VSFSGCLQFFFLYFNAQVFNFSFSGLLSRVILQETTGKSYSSCVVEMTKWSIELFFKNLLFLLLKHLFFPPELNM